MVYTYCRMMHGTEEYYFPKKSGLQFKEETSEELHLDLQPCTVLKVVAYGRTDGYYKADSCYWNLLCEPFGKWTKPALKLEPTWLPYR